MTDCSWTIDYARCGDVGPDGPPVAILDRVLTPGEVADLWAAATGD